MIKLLATDFKDFQIFSKIKGMYLNEYVSVYDQFI